MSEKRTLPARLADLRDRDPNAFLQACRRGGKNSAKAKKKRKMKTVTEYKLLLAEIAAEERIKSARIVAIERGDHLIPPDDH